MTPLAFLSELTRSLFSLWTLVLCLIAVFSIVRSVAQKRFTFSVFALVLFLTGYFLWQVLFDLHLFGTGAAARSVTRSIAAFPWIGLFLFLCVLTFACAADLFSVIRYGKRSITPDAVKKCLDRIPCGVCCYWDDGRVLFSNACMNRLCLAATGTSLLNGIWFSSKAGDQILSLEGRKWRFSRRRLLLDGEILHEVIAADVTAEYEKTEILQKEKEELSRLKEELKIYTLGIDDAVRHREILQAKVNVHDEMNRLMLSTVASLDSDTAAEDRVFSLWEKNALLLCREADQNEDSAAVGIEKLAAALKMSLVWKNEVPSAFSDEERNLFFLSAGEAIVNASKHAGAKRLLISFEETEDAIRCRFENDGTISKGEVRFTGGLNNLSVLAGKQGAVLSASKGETFILSLVFPKKRENQPRG